jgi:UMF1 family MFS transporter
VTDQRSVYAWALYDWANSAFATTVMAGFFPLFFKQYWSAEVPVTESTFYLGAANSLASLVVVLLAPILGALADQARGRKRFLAAFAALGALTTAALYLVGQGAWQVAAVLYLLGVIGFSGGNVFYDSLLVAIAAPKDRDRVSALGFALGYLGGGVLFAVNVAMTLHPHWFGLADAAEAVRWSFLSVGLWWTLFSIPILWLVEEPPGTAPASLGLGALFRGALQQLADTFRHLRSYAVAFRFLIAYWLYIDAVDTIVRMAVDYGLSIGLDSGSLITALLLTQFVGVPAAIVFGRIGERIGARNGILAGLAVYTGVTLYAYALDTATEFYILALVIGLVQGGVQALSRSLFSRLIPPERSAEFFGFYNMLGKFAAVLGPLLVGTVTVLSGNPRLGLMSLLILFIAGAAALRSVPLDRVADSSTRHSSR